jgi:hypothetical protein
MRREIGPDRRPGGPPMAYPKDLMSERAESGERNVRACVAAGASILTAIDVTAGATAMAWSQAGANGLARGAPVAREASSA